MKSKNKSVLIISDLHYPYNHPDVLAFFEALKKKYKFDRIICVGDELDYHALSFHDADPDLMSAGEELETSIRRLKPLYKLFPDVDLVESNHGSMVYRKQKHHGIPRRVFKSYKDILEAPKGWHWHEDLIITLPNKEDVYICHGKSKDALRLTLTEGMHTVQGHYHENLEVRFRANKKGLLWSMMVSCLIENSSFAFAYNKVNVNNVINGCGGIIDSEPRLFPMRLKANGRWNGKVP